MTVQTKIATGPVFADYLTAARANLTALVALAREHHDHEFAKEAQGLLDQYDDCAAEAWVLIEDATAAAAPESYVPSFGMNHPDSPYFGGRF